MCAEQSGIDKFSFGQKVSFAGNTVKGAIKNKINHMRKTYKPTFLECVVTWKCNSNCLMCNIPQTHDLTKQITLDQFKDILSDSDFWSSLRVINFTGGETFLRKNFVDVVLLFAEKCPSLERIAIPTNGFLPDLIKKGVQEILDKSSLRVDVTVSLDGVGNVHDTIRGTKGAFEKTIETIKALQELESNPRFKLFGQATLSKINYDHWETLKHYCDENNIFMSPGIVSFSENFFNNSENEEDLGLNREQISKLYSRNHFKDYYIKKQVKNKKRYLPCNAGFGTLIIDAYGDMYFCNNVAKIGNVLETPVRKLWYSKKAEDIRKTISKKDICKNCFWSCDLTDAIQSDFGYFLRFGSLYLLMKLGIQFNK